MRKAAACVLAFVVLVAAGCGGKAARMPVVVDTDLSTDDVVALLYVAANPALDLKAVTVSGTGVATCPTGARNALALLAVAGRVDVPVACGRPEPLAGANQFPVEWRARADTLFGLELPPARATPSGKAVDLLAETLRGGKTTLLSLAPMTDVAELIRTHPHLAKKLLRIVAMGGALAVPGNVGPGHGGAEFNIWVDPAAARKVLTSGVPLTLVPLDATNDVPATVFFAESLRRAHYATPAAAAAWELFVQSPAVWTGGQYFWDPLAAAALTRPSLLTAAEKKLRVLDTGRIVESASGNAVEVALHAHRGAFEHELLSTLLAGASFVAPKTAGPVALTFDGGRCTYAGPREAEAGPVAFDTLNRSGSSFTYTVSDPQGTVQMRGETPPNSRMTWVGTLPSGTKAIACTAAGRTSRVATVALFGVR